ncbi:Ger(x)C family spore germination protein [Paenibacillus sp. J5C_2022]|uniref:Ger(x)C family spore germination protein n=1 Tax=Paenibacillus sp. J5C2022 TaxID=2977129 RepID=UPI0021D238B6|nr:Ger(x)C family spore germination protein [Paenibacillus sp. J5C2022]MCU6708921.1 Ger(x)C family spore germination protein [Paenibacillus sp. J5C2022]
MNRAGTLLLLGAMLLLTGCWNRVELNEISIVSATGVDWHDGIWEVSFQTIIPQAIASQTGGSQTAAVNVFSTKGDIYRTAVSRASQETSRQLFFAHNQIIVVGEEAARKGLGSVMEVYLRNPDARETVNIFLAKGTARRMLEQLVPPEQIPGTAVQRMAKNEEQGSSSFRPMSMHTTMLGLLGGAQAVGIPGLTLAGTGESTDSIKQLGRTWMPSKVRLEQLGLIVGDQLVGWASTEQSRGIMWLSNHIGKTTIGIPCEPDKASPKQTSVRIMKSTTARKPEWHNGKWRMYVDIKVEAVLREYNCSTKLELPRQMDAIEKLIEQEIHKIAMNGWKAVSKHRADVVGFGDLIRKEHPRQWKDIRGEWRELFPQTDVIVTVKANIVSRGRNASSFKKMQEDARSK